jgi:hypothetical protein
MGLSAGASNSLYARRPRCERLEDRRMLAAGVTVITHGAQLLTGLPDWTVTMGQAILDRADGPQTSRSTGSMFQHDPATGLWNPIGNAIWNNTSAPDEHLVLLYNWSAESSAFQDGWLEAAADSLFASLIADNANLAGALAGTSFLDVALDSGGGSGLLNLHFIGHSRGAVLNSLVTERFDHNFSELTIDHVTTLDGHPARPMNDRGYVGDNPSANSRLFTYDNVRFADNYFQQDGNYEPLFPPDFDGVVSNGAFNLQLPSAVLENGGSSLEHSDVHSWYYGTITDALSANYSGFSGATRNNDGDVSFPEGWWGNSGVPPRSATGFAFSLEAAGDRAGLPVSGSKIAALEVRAVFNGDMAFAASGNALPGWEDHGGGGSASVAGGDLYLELAAGGNDYFRRHNPLYFSRHATAVQYDYWISLTNASTPDDQLQLLLGDRVLGTVSLESLTGGFIRDHQAVLGLLHTGFVAGLEFRIVDAAGDGIESAVRIDNVELVLQTIQPGADFNADGHVDGADFLAWQRGLGSYLRATASLGDANADGNVLADDLAVWRATFGEADQGQTVAAPPRTNSIDAALALFAAATEQSGSESYFRWPGRRRIRFAAMS